MKASDVPVGTRVKWRPLMSQRTPFDYATVIANNTRQGDEVLVVETEGRSLFMGVNVNDVEVLPVPSCEDIRKHIIDACEHVFDDHVFIVYDRAKHMEYIDPNTGKKYSVSIEVKEVDGNQ